MQARLVAGLFVGAIALLLWAIFSGPTQTPTPHKQANRAVERSSQAGASTPTKTVPRAEIVAPKLDFDDDSRWTKKDVAQNGLIGRSERWVRTIMDQPYWENKPRTDAPYRYVNQNGVELIWVVKNGRVIGAATSFPETAFSADLTALSEFFVGQNDHLPVHFESNEKGSVRFGDFKGTGGRTLYYRGRLRQSGTPPFGPEEFEIQMGPFPNQPIQHEPQRNEHLNPNLNVD